MHAFNFQINVTNHTEWIGSVDVLRPDITMLINIIHKINYI